MRQRLLVVPAQLVRPAGVPTLRIAPGYVYTDDFLNILKRIKSVRPLPIANATARSSNSKDKRAKRH